MRRLLYLFLVTFLLACQSVAVTPEISVIKTVDTDFSIGRIGLEHKYDFTKTGILNKNKINCN